MQIKSKASPVNPLDQARSMLRAKRVEEAEQLIDRLIQQDPSHTDALTLKQRIADIKSGTVALDQAIEGPIYDGERPSKQEDRIRGILLGCAFTVLVIIVLAMIRDIPSKGLLAPTPFKVSVGVPGVRVRDIVMVPYFVMILIPLFASVYCLIKLSQIITRNSRK